MTTVSMLPTAKPSGLAPLDAGAAVPVPSAAVPSAAVPFIAVPFVWPLPQLASYPLPARQSEPEPCEVLGRTGQLLVGQMLGIDMDSGVAQVRMAEERSPDAVPLPLRLDQMRRLTLTRPLTPLAPAWPTGTTPPPGHGEEAPHPARPYAVHWVGGGTERGDSIGHVEHELGLFVFPPVGNEGAVRRVFYPRHAYARIEIGAPLGDVLVAQEAVSAEAVDDAVQAQKKLRARKIGELLVARRIVTMEQLFTALDQQARMPMVRLGDALVALGCVSEAELAEALRQQSRDRELPLGELLVQRHLVSREQVREALAEKLGFPWIDLAQCRPTAEALRLLPAPLARRLQALPLQVQAVEQGSRVIVALADPTHRAALDELELCVGGPVVPVLASEDALAVAIAHAYPADDGLAPDETPEQAADALEQALEQALGEQVQAELRHHMPPLAQSVSQSSGPTVVADAATPRAVADSPLVGALATLVQEAVQRGATDIHIEVQAGADAPVQVRLRRDGRLEPCKALPAVWRHALVARIKTLADLDVGVTRRAQVGRLPFARLFPQALLSRPSAELTVTTVPTHQGLEDVVLRLPTRLRLRPLDQLGLEAWDLDRVRPLLEHPSGLLLVAGPSRSGRTSTLHAWLAELNQSYRTVYTAEERLEIVQPGLRQVEVAPPAWGAAGGPVWHTAQALRALQAADPDVLMIGELRDAETARIALDAAAAGKLVLAGMAARSAGDAVATLLDQGLDPHQLADTLLGVQSQRLLRRLCNHCRMSRPAKESEVDEWLDAWLEQALAPERASADEMKAQLAQVRQALRADWAERRGRDGRLKRYHAAGCPHCDGSGSRGHRAVFELLVTTRELRRLMRARAPAWHLHRQAQRDGLRTLRQDGIEKMLAGAVAPTALRALGD